ncbi:putative HIT finger domain protein [Paecilomyces variotii]|uniref:Putative HIT finger domain protein n=1 Tax=Byssochlamys spectabilis TaxID=264951 RepID=A0A443HRY3_BYSSP|nr:putative HIT finger domain protein [Paecilomyces variotii]KAJ9365444.1 hypothetical protein DTO280E4_413 [Paecilomyces variotii]RWQ94583.1 putative HIT finger domain protein [Paecilomyces variotii]
MPLVEVLTTSTSLQPGWTYVPDNGFDPSKAAIKPGLGRKRTVRDGGRTDLTSRENTAIVRHLAELDRENHRDVQIPIPTRQPKDAPARGSSRAKTTSNVRRILQSQKTFRNYLDDEEAALAQAAQHQSTAAGHRGSIAKITKPAARRSATPAAAAAAAASKPEKGRQQKQPSVVPSTTPAPAPSESTDPATASQKQDAKTQLIKSEYDNDPLLRSYVPSVPSERIMQALLAEPPLMYNASRAGPPLSQKPPRHFCAICGYWGKIRCRSCHVRTCGLDCYKVHEESRCGAFF